MARPKKDKPDSRVHVVGIRLTPDERLTLAQKAEAARLSLSELCRQASLGVPIEAASPPTEGTPAHAPSGGIAHIVALNRVGVNLNQIARALNTDLGFHPAELQDTLRRVNAVLDDWQGIA